MTDGVVAAVDLGATSGRVMLGRVSPGGVELRPVARFPNQPVRIADGLHWNILELYRNVLVGLRDAGREETSIASIGIDSWAVDYALLRGGRMQGTPYHYRDERTAAGVESTLARVSAEHLYSVSGLQHLPFNTVFQLASDLAAGDLDSADGFLLIPDLLSFWLTGTVAAETTNASTTGLLDVRSRTWSLALAERLGIPPRLFPDLVEPGTGLGALTGVVRAETGLSSSVPVTAVGSHDTASAVVAVPAASEDFAYISCGTWGLVGVELPAPVLSEAGRLAGFTNEGGVDGRVRYLHNVMGLWLLSESVRTWERDGERIELPGLIAAAAAVDRPVPVFDADDPVFLAPGDMPARIGEWFSTRGMPAPSGLAETVRSILESLAAAFARAVHTAAELSGVRPRVIHIVGGGSQNALLCRLTADRSGLPVLAGPVEATAIGNVLVQARAAGLAPGSLESLRAIVAASHPPVRYEPRATG